MKITGTYLWKPIWNLFLIMALTSVWQKTQAQVQTCNVSGNTDGNYAPFDICASGYSGSSKLFSACADLYLSTEICYATINAIQLWVTNTAGSPAVPVKIYMKTQAATTLTAGTYTNMLSGATLVYTNAAQSWLPAASVPGYQTFTLQTPFTYTTGNLIVIGEVDYNHIPSCGTAPVFGYATKTKTDEYWYNSTLASLLTTTGTVDQYRPGLDFSNINVVLPVELTRFTAEPAGTKTKLEWATATETNNNYFTVERSANGTDFNIIGTIKGAGNSTANLNYNTFDEEPVAGINYYRLKQTDYNGQSKYSEIVSVTYMSKEALVSDVYPNPTSDHVGVNLYSPVKTTGNIQLIDITGRVVSNELQNISAGSQELVTDVGSLEKGIYYLKLSIDELGYNHLSKIIKD